MLAWRLGPVSPVRGLVLRSNLFHRWIRVFHSRLYSSRVSRQTVYPWPKIGSTVDGEFLWTCWNVSPPHGQGSSDAGFEHLGYVLFEFRVHRHRFRKLLHRHLFDKRFSRSGTIRDRKSKNGTGGFDYDQSYPTISQKTPRTTVALIKREAVKFNKVTSMSRQTLECVQPKGLASVSTLPPHASFHHRFVC